MIHLAEFMTWARTDPAALCFHLGGLCLLAAFVVIAFLPVAGIVFALAAIGTISLAVRLVRGASIQPEAY